MNEDAVRDLLVKLAVVSAERAALLKAARNYIHAVRAGMPHLVQHGAHSLAFQAHADQTAAAWSELVKTVEVLGEV